MTQLVRYAGADGVARPGVVDDDGLRTLDVGTVCALLDGDLAHFTEQLAKPGSLVEEPVRLLAPVDGDTEVWAAGVTYRRSRDARMEEAQVADPYDHVYLAPRPELFFKAQAWRVSGPGEPVAVRADSTVDVPEPELAVVVTASGQIAGYTICNDVSSRSIEGENPLYLPQAKVYAGSCALGPGIVPVTEIRDPGGLIICMRIARGGEVVFVGRTDTGQIVRPLADLVAWLFEEQDFPDGAILSTGTGIVPELEFTLCAGDTVTVEIDGIGELTNPVVRGKQAMTWMITRRTLRA